MERNVRARFFRPLILDSVGQLLLSPPSPQVKTVFTTRRAVTIQRPFLLKEKQSRFASVRSPNSPNGSNNPHRSTFAARPILRNDRRRPVVVY